MSEEEREAEKREFEIHRILVALDASVRSLAALEAAAELAAEWHAELLGLFVEDVELLRLAATPAAIHCVYPSASAREERWPAPPSAPRCAGRFARFAETCPPKCCWPRPRPICSRSAARADRLRGGSELDPRRERRLPARVLRCFWCRAAFRACCRCWPFTIARPARRKSAASPRASPRPRAAALPCFSPRPRAGASRQSRRRSRAWWRRKNSASGSAGSNRIGNRISCAPCNRSREECS
jgi:hypothetical protein